MHISSIPTFTPQWWILMSFAKSLIKRQKSHDDNGSPCLTRESAPTGKHVMNFDTQSRFIGYRYHYVC